jgi:hypothetical protein
MSFRAASHAFDRRIAARRAATSGAVSALAFESPLARIWVETMGPLALGFAFYPVEVAMWEFA